MERSRATGPRLRDAVAISGIQPGGGFCIGLEARWGRLRRWWLRRFRPNYVANMARLVQGTCPDCPHDIIDPRDLKLWRNVCGHWFRPEDDRFAWRDRIGLARAGLAEVVVSSIGFGLALSAAAAAAATVHWLLWPLAAALAIVWFQAIRFFRDPERPIPSDPTALLSPTDGVVTHLHEVDDPDFPGRHAFLISVYLSPWDVHLNRIPRNGRVLAVRYFPGEFLNARHEQCSIRNEQLWLDLEDDRGRTIRVKQISGAMARRLVCWLRPAEAVRAGERYGMIKYGSRGEILVARSDAHELAVAVGDRVCAGQTVLLRFTGKS